MSRIITIALTGLATLLLIRAGHIHRDVWKAGESRRDLLAHFVDHTKVLTERELHEARFWSASGDHSSKTFTWYLLGGLSALVAADLLDRRARSTKTEQRSRHA